MNEIIIKDEIENMIYEIRGKQVMLDSDLANLYNTSTGNLNRAKNRNIKRFPNDFCFQLTLDEYDYLKCQNGISKVDHRVINRNLPFVYTEQGVAMLSSVLKTEIASDICVKIIKAFVKMKTYLLNENNRINIIERKMLFYDNKLIEHDDKFEILFEQFKTKNNHIFFEGQIYDAYSLLIDILNKAKKEIIIIDNYIDKNLLDILKEINKKILIITSKINEIDLAKYNEQYNNIEIIKNNKYHDRFIIIDKETLYHSGASLKDLGKKCFGINKIEDKEILNNLLKKIKS